MKLQFLVQQSDGAERFGRDGFDFGGMNNGGVASFMCKGDAILFAQELIRRTPDRTVRVLNTFQRRAPEVFRINSDLVSV